MQIFVSLSQIYQQHYYFFLFFITFLLFFIILLVLSGKRAAPSGFFKYWVIFVVFQAHTPKWSDLGVPRRISETWPKIGLYSRPLLLCINKFQKLTLESIVPYEIDTMVNKRSDKLFFPWCQHNLSTWFTRLMYSIIIPYSIYSLYSIFHNIYSTLYFSLFR